LFLFLKHCLNKFFLGYNFDSAGVTVAEKGLSDDVQQEQVNASVPSIYNPRIIDKVK